MKTADIFLGNKAELQIDGERHKIEEFLAKKKKEKK